MNERALLLAAAIFCGPALPSTQAAGQSPPATSADNITQSQVKAAAVADTLANLINTVAAKEGIAKLFQDPNLQKGLLDSFVKQLGASGDSNKITSLLNDLHLQPKVYQVKGSSGESVLGFEYAYDRSVAGRVINPESNDPLGLSMNFHAKGTVTATASKNPNNFLDTGITFNLFQAIGGVEPMIFTEEAAKASNKAVQEATKITATDEDWHKDPRWAAIVRAWSTHIRPQTLWYVAGNGALESDQQFLNKQWTYGGQVGLSVRDWRDTSWATWLNIPDYPFAVLRAITDSTESFKPSGHSFPTLIGGVDLVDPKDNKDRLAIDPDKSSYQRLRGEIAFKTKVGLILGKPVWLSASYRVFRETSPSPAIKAARLDRFEYFVADLEFADNFSISYSKGKLPLDRVSDQVFALGYKLSL